MLEAPVIQIVVRQMCSSDSLEELTSLLHRAYADQVARGLKPLAGRQTVEITRARTSTGENYIATMGERGPIVGTILLQEKEAVEIPAWFRRSEVAHFSLFGVDPEYQGHGIGCLLLDAAEKRATEIGKHEISLSMADPDDRLRAFYAHRGYRYIEPWQWPYTNYLSAILSKSLLASGPRPTPGT